MLLLLAVVELEVLDVVELVVDVVELGMLVVCADVVDGVPVVLAEWVMAVVLCGSKAKDTASCGKWKTVQNSWQLLRNGSGAARRGGGDSSWCSRVEMRW